MDSAIRPPRIDVQRRSRIGSIDLFSRLATLAAPAALAGGGLGTLLASVATYAALDHNPQGEFYDRVAGVPVWEAILPITLSWFCIGLLVGAITCLACVTVISRLSSMQRR